MFVISLPEMTDPLASVSTTSCKKANYLVIFVGWLNIIVISDPQQWNLTFTKDIYKLKNEFNTSISSIR